MTYADSGLYVDYDYLVTGEVAAIRENGATSGAGLLGAYAYDDRGRRTSLTRGNGTVTGYSYDNVSRLTELVQNLSGTSHDLTLGLGYNPASQIASNTRSNDAYAWGGHYAVSRSYAADGLNQYTATGSITPTYDNRGNLTSAGSITYGYDADNMLTSATGGITLAYDSLQRLHETAGGSTTRLAYDGDTLIAEYNSSNTLLRRYVHGPGADEPIVWYEGTGTSDRRWLHADERGSVIAISNGSGAVTNVNAYDESGIPALANVGRFQAALRVTLPLGLALALVSCRYDFRVATNPTPDGPRFSVGSAVSTLPRPGPRCVHSVIVYRDNSRQPIWMIERVADCPSVASFVYGIVPSGWQERIAAAPLEAGVYYVAIADSGSGGGARFSADGTPAR